MKKVLCVLLLLAIVLCTACDAAASSLPAASAAEQSSAAPSAISSVRSNESLPSSVASKTSSRYSVPLPFEEGDEILMEVNTGYRFYYVFEKGIYRSDIYGERVLLLYPSEKGYAFSNFCYVNERIYFEECRLATMTDGDYMDDFRICSFDRNGENFSVIADEELQGEGFVRSMDVFGDNLIIVVPFLLYIYNTKTECVMRLDPDARELEIKDGKLYYSGRSPHSKIYDFKSGEIECVRTRESTVWLTAEDYIARTAEQELIEEFSVALNLLPDGSDGFSSIDELSSDDLFRFAVAAGIQASWIDSDGWYREDEGRYVIALRNVIAVFSSYLDTYKFSPSDLSGAQWEGERFCLTAQTLGNSGRATGIISAKAEATGENTLRVTLRDRYLESKEAWGDNAPDPFVPRVYVIEALIDDLVIKFTSVRIENLQ